MMDWKDEYYRTLGYLILIPDLDDTEVPGFAIKEAFWKLKPHTRRKIISGWDVALQKLAKESELKEELPPNVIRISDYTE